MKQTLLLIFFVFLTATAVTAQLGIGGGVDGLAQQEPIATNIKVFPNPATNYIGLSNSKGIEQIAIYNVVGRKIKTFKVAEDKQYNIADLPNGMYLIQLINKSSKIVKTHRLSKR